MEQHHPLARHQASPVLPAARATALALPLALALLLALTLGLPARAGADAQETIVGGTVTTIGTWPSTVALLTHGTVDSINSQFCGGTLVADRWVVTAAHCTRGYTAAQIDAVTGRTDMNTSTGQRIQVQAIYDHPSYNDSTKDSDLSLLYLSSASTQATMALIEQGDPQGRTADGTQGITVGWGDTISGSGAGSNVLRQVTVPIIATATANAADWYAGGVTANMFAAGYAAGGKDSCQGDSGGPYMVPSGSGGYVLAGAVSWGNGCADPKQPGVYTRLSNFRTWIDGKMNGGGGGGRNTPVPALGWVGWAVLAMVLGVIGSGSKKSH
jgi:trypsin